MIAQQTSTEAPSDLASLYRLALARYTEQRLDEAIELLEVVVRAAPAFAPAHGVLGSALLQKRRFEEAAAMCARAVDLGLANRLGYGLLGEAQQWLGRHAEAVASFDRAIADDPTSAQMWFRRGCSQVDLNRNDEAALSFARAVALDPGHAEAHFRFGEIANAQGRIAEALAAYGSAIDADPRLVAAYSKLGQLQAAQGLYREALATSERAFAAGLADLPTQYNIGNALYRHARPNEAIACFDRAVAIAPDHAITLYNRATAYLMAGDFRNGWAAHESRYEVIHFEPLKSAPQWRGESIRQKTILVQLEQGLGDVMQFCRYIDPLVLRAGGVVLHVPLSYARLYRLLVQTFPNVAIVTDIADAPHFDVHSPLMSLPLAFGTTIETIPPAPYLKADAAEAATWASRLQNDPGFKVGLAWAGGAHSHHPAWVEANRRRNLSIRQFAPLAGIEGIRLFSLQKSLHPGDDAVAQTKSLPAGFELIDLNDDMPDMAATAAFVANLDLVITVDTSIAHLAGGLGRPVWVLSRFDGDWRWLLDRDDSPWYPTVRLFRQSSDFDWSAVIGRVADALRNRPT